MRPQASVPVPRGWTGESAWKGAGASLLLHLFVGAAVIVALSGPPRTALTVVDLTLLPPADAGRRSVVPVFTAAAAPARDPGTVVLPEPPAVPAPPTVASPPDAAAPPPLSGPSVNRSASSAGFSPASDVVPVLAGQGPVTASTGGPPRTSGSGSPPTADFAWIRDAIQHAIVYPATARRMGWEGKVVVAFQLLSDGSVRNVRVVQGSGHAALDRGATDAVRSASPFRRSPVEAEVITPVVYRLTSR